MKIIGTSNFDRDSVSDILIAENVHEYWADKFVKMMNTKSGKYSTYFYQVKPDNYKLYEWEP